MLAKDVRKILSAVLSLVLVNASSQMLRGYQTPTSAPAADSGDPTEPAPMSTSELQGLVAPIAVYP